MHCRSLLVDVEKNVFAELAILQEIKISSVTYTRLSWVQFAKGKVLQNFVMLDAHDRKEKDNLNLLQTWKNKI